MEEVGTSCNFPGGYPGEAVRGTKCDPISPINPEQVRGINLIVFHLCAENYDYVEGLLHDSAHGRRLPDWVRGNIVTVREKRKSHKFAYYFPLAGDVALLSYQDFKRLTDLHNAEHRYISPFTAGDIKKLCAKMKYTTMKQAHTILNAVQARIDSGAEDLQE